MTSTPSDDWPLTDNPYAIATFSRRIIGWSAASNKATALVPGALEIGLW